MNVVNYHLTNACNYNCKYCFGKFATNDYLKLEDAKKIVDNISSYFRRNNMKGRINLAGGEPMLYPFLNELIEYIASCGVDVSIITNGSLLTADLIRKWKGKVCMIGISVDSPFDKTNFAIGRQIASGQTLTQDRLSELANEIHNCNIKLKVNTVVSKFNYKEDFVELYRLLNIDRLKFLKMQVVENINVCCEQYTITEQEFQAFCNKHKRCAKNVVVESEDIIQNSYIMINPIGYIVLNDKGIYKEYESVVENDFQTVIESIPYDYGKFQYRYQ